MQDSASHRAIKRLIPPLAAWVLGKILETPKVKGALQEADSRAYVQRRNAERAVKRATKNAKSQPVWLAAGVGAIAVGIVLMAKAARGK